MIRISGSRSATAGVLAFTILALNACGDATADDAPAVTIDETVAGEAAIEATGEVIEIEMHADSFEPRSVEARPGDVLRFVNVQDVHNVSWPAAKNPGVSSLPAASPFMTAPGQTHDVQVTMSAGEYHFQCDPHVPMGMVGTLTVVE